MDSQGQSRDEVLAACKENGAAYQNAAEHHKADKDIVLAALSHYGIVLQAAPRKLPNDKEVVLAACSQNGYALKFAFPKLRNDKEVVLVACSQYAGALEYASQALQGDMEVVLAACYQEGYALKFASEVLKADKEVVMAAAECNPESLKFALEGLNQDKDCLIKAKLWDNDYIDIMEHTDMKRILFSTRFSLAAENSAHATRFTVELKKHPYIASNCFVVYSPNAFNKGTCDPEWTNKEWPCRGTYYESCQNPPEYKTGVPQVTGCCWRYSFRYHLEEAFESGV